MAGDKLTINMGDDDALPAWQTVIELSRHNVSTHLTLIGDLMVAAHAHRAGVLMKRPTDDVDVLVDYATDRGSLHSALVALVHLGFNLHTDGKHAYRFTHADGRKLDLMVADHLPSRMQPRLNRRPVFFCPSRRTGYSSKEHMHA